MKKEAIHHQPYGSYAYPINEKTLFLQLRAKKDDLEEAYVLYDGRFDWVKDSPRYRVKMKKDCTDEFFDYFTAKIDLDNKKFRYNFLLNDDKQYLYYGELGFQSQPPARKESFEYTYICENDLFSTPEWVQNAVFYQIFPERFCNANPDLNPDELTAWSDRKPESDSFYGGDLEGIINKLDYLSELGIDAIYLTPVFPSASNHKYNIRDYKKIDPHFGDLNTAKKLVNQAHARDIKIIFDAVFNHSSNQFFAFKNLQEQGADSDYTDWYYIDQFPIKEYPTLGYANLKKLFEAVSNLSNETNFNLDFLVGEMLSELEINYDKLNNYEQEFLQILAKRYKTDDRLKTMSHKELWYFVQSDEEVKNLMKPNYEAFANRAWAMPKLRTANPEVQDYLLEVGRFWIEEIGIDGWRLDVADEVDHNFWREFRRVVKAADPNAYIVGEVWKDSTRWLAGDQFDGVMNYIFAEAVLDFFCRRNIDANNFAHRLTRVKTSYKLPAQLASLNLIDSHDTSRALTIAEGDKTKLKLAVAFQMTYLGPPMIYYGDEVGLKGGDDPDCRRTMLWDDDKQDKNLLEWYKDLIQIRQENPALRTGDVKVLEVDPAKNIYAFIRKAADNRLLVIFNNNLKNNLELDLNELGTNVESLLGLLDGETYTVKNGLLKFELDDYSVKILKSQ